MVSQKVLKDNFTYEFWVRIEKSASENDPFMILPKYMNEDTNIPGIGIAINHDNIQVVEISTKFNPIVEVNRDLNYWTHIAVVYQNKKVFLYINGILVKNVECKRELILSVPKRFNSKNFAGGIRGLRIWSYSRNASQIKSFMNQLLSSNEKGLLFNYHGDLRNKTITKKRNTDKKNTKKDTKIIAFYLPQFHEIQENNKWWGKGFTEWSNTKKAKPLFNNHYQPREPYRDFYYDLTNPGVREWQANLAKKYGIYGFCYYHYWFKGRRLLERPFNDVLTSGKPDFPFCLSWANEPWTRKWNGGSKAILMPQNYGDKKDWKEHFNYLIKAFKDERYIRVENKPLFIIYRPELIPNLLNMMEYWDKLAKQQGLEGIYFVQTFNGFRPLAPINRFDAAVEFEPHFTLAHGRNNNFWRTVKGFSGEKKILDYDRIWESILNRNTIQHKKIFLGAFNDWDNTARMQASSTIYQGASPSKFKNYLSHQIYRAKNVYDSEFLFINAWNEWAEGAYLEPDKRYKYRYLEAVRDALKMNY